MKIKWRFRFRRNFFGLSHEYVQSVYEQFFYMKYYGGWSLFELYNLPIGLRNWYFKKLISHKEQESEEMKKSSSKNKAPSRSRF